MSYFMQFWPILGPCDPLISPLYYQRSTLNGSYSPKILHQILHEILRPENGFFSIFFEVKMTEKYQMSYFMQIWPILGPYDPLKSPLYYRRSTLNGSCSPKILHKIVLPEIGFNPIFFEVKMTEKCQKCHISCKFDQFWDHMTHSKAPYTTDEVH